MGKAIIYSDGEGVIRLSRSDYPSDDEVEVPDQLLADYQVFQKLEIEWQEILGGIFDATEVERRQKGNARREAERESRRQEIRRRFPRSRR